MSAFIPRVVAACESRGISSVKLAELSGINQSTCYRILHGQSTPTIDTATKLAAALGISLDGPTGPGEFARSGDVCVEAEEAWSAYYNSATVELRPHLTRDQFIAGFMAGRES